MSSLQRVMALMLRAVGAALLVVACGKTVSDTVPFNDGGLDAADDAPFDVVHEPDAVSDSAEEPDVVGDAAKDALDDASTSCPGWTRIVSQNAPQVPREDFVSVWTGSQLVVWGGRRVVLGGDVPVPGGGIYTPATHAWAPLGGKGYPSFPGPKFAAAVWTGKAVLVGGGDIWGSSSRRATSSGGTAPTLS